MWNLKRNDTNELTKQKDSQTQRINLWLPAHTAIFKTDNQQGPTVQHGTPLNVMWQPGWEGSLGENGYMYMHD